MTSTKAAKIFFDEKERNGAQMKWQTNDSRKRRKGRLYEIKVDVRLSYMKSFHAKCKFHDYSKVKLWTGFGVKWNWIAKFYCYTKSKPRIVCNRWQKSELSEKFKENIILNLFEWLKKTYESVFVEKKILIIECRVKHCFRKSHFALLQNKNAPRLIKKFLRKHHAEKWKILLKSPGRCFFY